MTIIGHVTVAKAFMEVVVEFRQSVFPTRQCMPQGTVCVAVYVFAGFLVQKLQEPNKALLPNSRCGVVFWCFHKLFAPRLWQSFIVPALGTRSLFRECKKSKPCLADYGPRASLSAGDSHPRHAKRGGDFLLSPSPLTL